MKAYIYKIENIKNNKKYIGSTINFEKRKKYHLWELRNNRHHSIILQRAWNKYKEHNFIIKIIGLIDYNDIVKEEQNYINLYGEYNSNKIANIPPLYAVPIIIYDKNYNYIGDFKSIQHANRVLNEKMSNKGKYPYYSKGYFIFKSGTKIKDIKYHIRHRYDKLCKIKPIYQFSLNCDFIKEWECMSDASLIYSGKKLNNNILQSIKNSNSAYGFLWSFSKKCKFIIDKRENGIKINIYKNNELLYICKSINEASRKIKKHKQTISIHYKNKTKTTDGYYFN